VTRTPSSNNAARSGEAGFTLIEAVVAISLLSVGLLGVASVISYSMTSSTRSRNVTKAKQVILSELEQIAILRDTGRLSFDQISNSGGGGFPGFSVSYQQVTNSPGADGIFGTGDDGRTDTDDSNNGFQRSVVITDLNPTLKKIEVSVHYPSGQHQETLAGVGYMNDDTRGTYRR
jgi:prepilin-type N-terminal cleavage/methylation domain-containing protein